MSNAFPVIYARDVKAAVRFYERLGFEQHYQFPPEGEPEYVGLQRDAAHLGIVHESSPQRMIGQHMGDGPRFDLFVYVDDVDAAVGSLRDADVPVSARPRTCRGGADCLRVGSRRKSCDARNGETVMTSQRPPAQHTKRTKRVPSTLAAGLLHLDEQLPGMRFCNGQRPFGLRRSSTS